MAQVVVRANLSSVQIPLLTEEFGRSVIVRQQDLNYNPTTASKADIDKDIGIPQVYYAHNVMPTYYGFRSVAFANQIPGIDSTTFSQVFPLLSASGQKAFLAVNTNGYLYVCHAGTGYAWQGIYDYSKAVITAGTNTGDGYVVSAAVYDGAGSDVYVATFTTATVFSVTKNAVAESNGTAGTEYVSANSKVKFTINSGATAFAAGDSFTFTLSTTGFSGNVTVTALSGNTYICSEGSGIFHYDFDTNKLVWRLATGLESTEILGITGSNGYLIAYSTEAVAWSSVIDPLDFIPSLSTGAGSGSVEDAKGPIRRVVGLTSGYLVFTARNCVAAVFSQNIRYPFTFREVPNAGGISDLSLVTDEADSTSVYAYTSFGLQQISTQKATNVMPELSDFLTGKRFEDFDSDLLSFSVQNLTAPLKKRIEFISGRFLIISYGVSSFTHCIIYDSALQRFGKIKTPHVSTFQYGFLDADDADTPKKQVAFLQANGTVRTLDFSASANSPDSVVLLGKYQFLRNKTIQLDSVELETVEQGASFSVYDLVTYDGKTFEAPILGYRMPDSRLARHYNFRVSGMNHTLVLAGTFRLNSLQISFNTHGRR